MANQLDPGTPNGGEGYQADDWERIGDVRWVVVAGDKTQQPESIPLTLPRPTLLEVFT